MSIIKHDKKVSKLFSIMLISSLGLFGCSDNEEVAPVTDTQDPVVEETTTPEVETTVDDTVDTGEEVTPDAEGLESPPVDAPDLEGDPVEVPPVDETDMADSDTAEAEPAMAELSANAGQELYDNACHVCHAQGLLDAPKLGDKEAWAPRIAKGIDTLHQHSAEGFGKMPPQAIGDISEAQVYAAVDYMVEQSS